MREELGKPRFKAPQANAVAVAEMVRDEIWRVVTLLPVPQPELYIMTYSDVLRSSAPVMRAFPPFAAVPSVQYPITVVSAVLQKSRPAMNKAHAWRTPNNRPFCYHCGEPGHSFATALTIELVLWGVLS